MRFEPILWNAEVLEYLSEAPPPGYFPQGDPVGFHVDPGGIGQVPEPLHGLLEIAKAPIKRGLFRVPEEAIHDAVLLDEIGNRAQDAAVCSDVADHPLRRHPVHLDRIR